MKSMMKFLSKLNSAKEGVHLPDDRKALIRGRLQKSMKSQPAKIKALAFPSVLHAIFTKSVIIPLLVFFVVASGAATAYAAKDSMPGDVLYSVKLNVNEKVMTAMVQSDEQKAEAHLDLFADRLAEAVKLTAENQLNEDNAGYMETLFDRYESAAQDRIDALNNKGNTQAADVLSARLEQLISIHQQILAQLANKQSDGLVTVLKAEADQNESDHNDFQPQNEDQFKQAASNKINAAANILAHVDTYISGQSGPNVVASSKAAAETKFQTAETTLATAKTQFEEGKFEDAFRSAGTATRLALEAKTVLRLDSQYQVHIELKDDDAGEVRGQSDTPSQDNNSENDDNHGQENKSLLNLPIRFRD